MRFPNLNAWERFVKSIPWTDKYPVHKQLSGAAELLRDGYTKRAGIHQFALNREDGSKARQILDEAAARLGCYKLESDGTYRPMNEHQIQAQREGVGL